MKKRTKFMSIFTTICLLVALFSSSAAAIGEDDETAPTMTELTVTFTDNTTASGTTGILCEQGKEVDNIKVTMSEAVTVSNGAVVTMIGTAGDCAVQIPSSVTYGTITLDETDETDKTLIITPNGSNGTAAYAGEMTFTVASGAVADLSENDCDETTFDLTVSKVSPVGEWTVPVSGSAITGTETFTFPFTTTYGNLAELELDIYLGDNTGESRDYSNSAGMNLPANSTELNGLIDGINTLFMTKSREELITYFGEGNDTVGEAEVRIYEAAGFRVGEDKAATVKNNISFTGDTTTGTWTLTLNTYMLKEDALELLVAVKNDQDFQWGNNDFTQYGDLTKDYLYSLTVDEEAPTVDNVTVEFTDGTTKTGTDALFCNQGQIVKSIKVVMNEAVTLSDGVVVTMIGTAGDCAEQISESVTYGTIALDTEDDTNKTLIITPNGSNGTAGYLGEVVFTVAEDSYQDDAENKNNETSFTLNVGYTFDDVADDIWYSEAIAYISARGITIGIGDDLFAPGYQITRAEFIVMLMRAFDIDPYETWTDNFNDAGTDEYYSGYLAKAKELNIVIGVGGNMYAPYQKISREEMFTMLYRALDAMDMLPEIDAPDDLSGFGDADLISDYALESFQFFVAADIVHGDSNMLRPLDPATRAQTAQVLCNILTVLENVK